MDYCPHCMTRTTSQVCPSCGKATHWQAPANQLPVGTLLRSNGDHIYQLGAAKGQGGFGITYAAMDLRTNSRVAIKEYFPSHCAGRDTMTRVICSTGQRDSFESGLRSFLQEAKTLSSVGALDSVVSVRDVFESNGTAYIVMEYVDGQALNQVVAARGRMYKQELFPILQPLLRDLGILHRAGVIHRDISPDNLILTREGKLKLLDFGAARSTSGQKNMTVMLKAGFSPLEQYQSNGQGPYTDVYAMAGTIYYCLTGRVPPVAVDRIQTDELIMPNALGAGLTQREQDALVWGLGVFADRRPQNVEAFANALLSTPGTNVFEPPVRQETQHQMQYNVQSQNYSQPQNYSQSQYQTQSQTGSKAGFGKGLAIGIGAAVVAVALLVTGLAVGGVFGGNKKGPQMREEEDERPATTEARAPTVAEMPVAPTAAATEPAVEVMISEDGYAYTIENGEAVIVGYEGPANSLLVFPDTLDGYTVTVLAEGCVQGNTAVECALLPINCTEIRANAFAGCINLKEIGCYSTSKADPSAFSGCTRLRCILLGDGDSVDGWTLPANCMTFNYQMETGMGPLISTEVDANGVIYGITDDNEAAVILDVPSGLTYLEVPATIVGCPVLWMHSGALDHASSNLTVMMCPELAFDLSLVNSADWDCNSVDDFCWNWFFTCVILDDINSGLTDRQLVPDRIAVEGAMIRARELEQHYDYNIRPDGGNTPDLLDGMGLDWIKATIWDGTIDTSDDEVYNQQFDAVFVDMAEQFSGTHSEGYYYDALGAALWYSETQPTIFVYGIGIIRG